MFTHFWLFVQAVWVHAVTLAAGCIVTVVINLIEKYVIKRTLGWKGDLTVLLIFLFFACFQAWRDEYEKAAKASSGAPFQITNQVNVPPINVPPPTVIIQQTPNAPLDLTGVLQIDTVQPVTGHSAIVDGQTVGLNVYYKNVGTQPIHAKYSIEAIIIADMAVPNIEQQAIKVFAAARKKNQQQTLASGNSGDDVAVAQRVFRTAYSSVLNKPQADAIRNESARLYLMAWATWKDSHNRIGKLDACYWLQKPSDPDGLTVENTIWHTCEVKK
jgi:hypothetical protein